MILAEDNFDQIIKEIYEEHFIDLIFPAHESNMTNEDFILAIEGNYTEDSKCPWIFDPAKIRELFIKHVDLSMISEFTNTD